MTDRPTPTRPASPDLRIVDTLVYRGPNVWSDGPAMHLVVDLGTLEEYPTDLLPGFSDRLLAWLPGVGAHSCSRGRRGGFAERLRAGTWLGHVAEHVALQLQNEAGHDATRGRTRSTGVPGQYHVVYGYQDEATALAAGRLAIRIINDLVAHDPTFDFAHELEAFLLGAARTAVDWSTQALVDEAVARDIPWMRLAGTSLVQLGQGCHARWIRGAMTANTSALAADIANDKELADRILAAAGLPVPQADAGQSGREHRFLVVGGRTVAVAERIPAQGGSIDRTADAHPDNIELAEEAARVVGLDVAGVDIIASDIAVPVREAGGAIGGVHADPGLRMHTHPTIGQPQRVAGPVLDLLFPPGSPSRVPVVAVTGTNGKTTVARMIGHVLKGTGRTVGLTSTDGIVIDERLVIRADASGPGSARMVLANPKVDFAVLEVDRAGILREGLGYDRNDVAVVLNVAADHLDLPGISTMEDLADVKSVVVEAVPRGGYAVLNADDPLVAAMAGRCHGEVVWFSMSDAGSPARAMIERHCGDGGVALVLDRGDLGESISLRQGKRSAQLAFTHLLPATFGGMARFNVANALAAAGACFAAGAHLRDIRAGLLTFCTSYDLAPGRLNRIEINGVHVFVDRAHNPAGLEALGGFIGAYTDGLGASSAEVRRRRRIAVIAAGGDEDAVELGRVAARHFDLCVVRGDLDQGGRQVGEVAALVEQGVREGIAAGGRTREVHASRDEIEAVRWAVAQATAGDVLAICVDRTDMVYAELEALGHSAMHE